MRFELDRDLRRLAQEELSRRTATVTLAASTTTTTLTDARIRFDSPILMQPTTANAAGALATTYILEASRVNGSVVITHASNSQTDRIFRVFIG